VVNRTLNLPDSGVTPAGSASVLPSEDWVVNRFVVRERDSGLFVDRWAKLHGELGLAHVFPSAEEAEFYRSTLEQPDRYESCPLNSEGLLVSAKTPTSGARPGLRSRRRHRDEKGRD